MMMSASTPVSPAELEARLRLHRLPDVGPKRFAKLLEAFGDAQCLFLLIPHIFAERLLVICDL